MNKLPVLLVAALLQLALAAPAHSIEIGEPIPDFGIRTFSGEVVSRTSLSGRPLLLVFWNSWSAPSKKELPVISHLARKFAEHGLAVLAIGIDPHDNESKTRAFWARHHLLMPAGFDRYLEIGPAFGIRQTPTLLLVDSWGIVRYKNRTLPDDLDRQLQLLYTR